MTGKEKKLFCKLCEDAVNLLENESCNDIPVEYFNGWTKEELQNLALKAEGYNGSPEDYDKTHTAECYPDWFIARTLLSELKND